MAKSDWRAPTATRRILMVGLLYWAIAHAPVLSSARLDPIIVENDPGGSLQERVAVIKQIRQSKRQVRIIRGDCLSSCTLYLGLPNMCVAPDVRFGFHGPSSRHYGFALPAETFEKWSRIMARHYPPKLRTWFLKTARHRIVGFHFLSGRDLISLGVRDCTET